MLLDLCISSGREELRKVAGEEGGENLDEKLRRGNLLPQVLRERENWLICQPPLDHSCDKRLLNNWFSNSFSLQNEVVGLVELILTTGELNKGSYQSLMSSSTRCTIIVHFDR